MMKYWNALFNRGTKEAKKAFEANMHLQQIVVKDDNNLLLIFMCKKMVKRIFEFHTKI